MQQYQVELTYLTIESSGMTPLPLLFLLNHHSPLSHHRDTVQINTQICITVWCTVCRNNMQQNMYYLQLAAFFNLLETLCKYLLKRLPDVFETVIFSELVYIPNASNL